MDTATILKSQRNLILQKYGFKIEVEEDNLSNYKYTVSTYDNGGFTATLWTDLKSETGTLLQLLLYMDRPQYQIAYARALAYEDCYRTCTKPKDGYWCTNNIFQDIKRKRDEAIKVDIHLLKDFVAMRLNDITALQCNNILSLEDQKKNLEMLLTELNWLQEAAGHKNLDYESVIPLKDTSNQEENI